MAPNHPSSSSFPSITPLPTNHNSSSLPNQPSSSFLPPQPSLRPTAPTTPFISLPFPNVRPSAPIIPSYNLNMSNPTNPLGWFSSEDLPRIITRPSSSTHSVAHSSVNPLVHTQDQRSNGMNYKEATKKPVEGSNPISGAHPDLSFQALMQQPHKLIQAKDSHVVDGKPAISFSSVEVQALSHPFALTLVGKFMGKSPPKITDIMPDFKKLNLK